ncbi:MAG TPA: acetate/propionate family kinase [Solirubrobacterales bacterium]
MHVLVVNVGSSSLRLTVLDSEDRPVFTRGHPSLSGSDLTNALREALEQGGEVEASGHRIVHGGERFREPTRLDPSIDDELAALDDLAPLHNPPAVAAVRALRELRPELPAVACFDTAFHATLPAAASTYALPAEWSDRWTLRRYGFHGLSHAWIARRAPELLERPAAELRIVSCHLGAGASLTAIDRGSSVETTMGFTPLEGLVMATRSGSIDPGLLLWVQDQGELTPERAQRALESEAGLLGLSRRSGDMREVIAGAEEGDERCRLAIDVYTHRLRAFIAAMAAAMGGLDALAFTGGVGEGSPRIRAMAAEGLGFLEIEVDPELNRRAEGDTFISLPGAGVVALVVEAREDLQIAAEVRACLTQNPARPNP